MEFDQQDQDAQQVREYVLHVDGEHMQEPVMSDAQADALIREIHELDGDMARITQHIQDEIHRLELRQQEIIRQKTARIEWRKAMLMQYMATIPARRTKTQVVYELAYGTLRLKEMPPKFERDETALLRWAENYLPDAVKVKKSADWATIKKQSEVRDGKVYVEGFEVEGVTVEPQAPRLDIEFV